ncbi:MAG: alpha/beta hydrolase [Pseudomonas sp.]|nr:alpha/beta hydrolase [Pseudomonas sp.]
MLNTIEAGVLNVAYYEDGPADGWPVVLLHGFPYDVHAYSQVTPLLVAQGARVITPYLRGCGPTRFLSPHTPRSGQQAALGYDLLKLLDALSIESAILVGYDWGGRAACIVAALWPQRVQLLVSIGSYNIQNIANAMIPAKPEQEFPYWYQYYFHSERGRAALQKDRRALCRLLWKQWSPIWSFTDDEFERSAEAFDNPDFVEVVIHSYRHRFGLVEGDPALQDIETRLATLPPILAPTLALDGAADGLRPQGTQAHAKRFEGEYRYASVAGAGHNLPQETPEALAALILDGRP